MNNKQQIENKIKRLQRFDDPVLLMLLFLCFPAVAIATLFTRLGDGTLIKLVIALCFLFFTWLAFKVSSVVKQRIEILQAQLTGPQ